jgi:thiol-disulfide isomerase/thioredoxin
MGVLEVHSPMKGWLLASFALVMMSAAFAFAQSTTEAPSTPSSNGLDLLLRVAQHYADARSYYIESVEERTITREYGRSWSKTILVAAQASGDRSYYEGRTDTGSSIKVEDGKTVWRYRVDEHRYTAKPQSSQNASSHGAIAMQEMGVRNAENLRRTLADMALHLKSAERLADETLTVNGQQVLCLVVRVRSSDQKREQPDYLFEKTIWIDAERNTILKTVEHVHTFMSMGTSRLPMEEEIATTYTKMVLDGDVQDSLFIFTPPSDAKLVQDFPDPRESSRVNMTGEQVPPLKLKSADGKVVGIEAFRGKPVLLDFWATWCAPCVAALPELAEIFQEAKEKGLVLLAVDQDEDQTAAANFLAKKGYSWPDYHDGDGAIEKLMGSSGVPRAVLVDAQGMIVYDTTGVDGDKLRTHLAKLGPEFASLAPKPKPAPCAASK